MASKVKITKITQPKSSIKKTPAAHGVSAPHIRPKATSGKVTTVKPGTLRITPQNLKTTMKHPGQPTGKAHGTMKTIKNPR